MRHIMHQLVCLLSIPSHGLSTNDTVGIGTSSIVFSCEMDHYGSDHPYPRPTDPMKSRYTNCDYCCHH